MIGSASGAPLDRILHGHAPAVAGGSIWFLALIALRPDPLGIAWSHLLLMLAPLVMLPLALRLLPDDAVSGRSRFWLDASRILQPPAALALGGAFLLPQGIVAAILALPWVAMTGLLACHGVARLRRRGLRPLHELCVDAGLVYVAVGGVWACFDRLGVRPLDFSGVIVLLTAIHFHYAGLALPLMTGFAMRHAGVRAGQVAGIAAIAGVPSVAIGITATQIGFGPFLECVAAWLTALSGVSTAGLHLRLASRPGVRPLVRVLWAVSAGSLAAGMILAGLYGTRFYAPVVALDIPWMRALHGTANALGFGLAGLVAWTLAGASRSIGRAGGIPHWRTSPP